MIDFKEKKIIGNSGTVYHIDPENISTGRWQQYMIQSAALGLGVSYQEIFDSYTEMYKAVTSGNDILKALKTIQGICEAKLKFIDKYHANTYPKVVEFCALFCNEEKEDVSLYEESMIKRKFEDWQHIPIKDFFLLSSLAIPKFQENYNLLMDNEGKSLTEILTPMQ